MKTRVLFTLIIFIAMTTNIKSQQINKLKDEVFTQFQKKVYQSKSKNTGLLLIHSPSMDIHWKMSVNPDSMVKTSPDQTFHFASIGKTITSVMICILYEHKLIDFDDNIAQYLDDSIISGLHIYKNVDYSNQLKIKHLLNHTSGLPDYYVDKNKSKVCLLDLMISEPERFWTPIETIEWAKHQLKPKFKPDYGFHYSDTNYQLLGLIIEEVTGLRLYEAFQKYIFEPLEMNNTYQIFYSEPKYNSEIQMVDLYYKGLNLSKAKSISMSWASGGTVSTTEDMLKFHKSLVNNKIIQIETFNKMCSFTRMRPSLYYGYGIMNFRFLLMPQKYDIWGNSGSIGAFMYYNPAMDIYIIGSFHEVNYQIQPIFFIFNTLRKFNKHIKNLKKNESF